MSAAARRPWWTLSWRVSGFLTRQYNPDSLEYEGVRMENAAPEQSPFSKVTQIGIVVRDMDKAVERLSSLGIGPFKPKLLPPDREEGFRERPLDGGGVL